MLSKTIRLITVVVCVALVSSVTVFAEVKPATPREKKAEATARAEQESAIDLATKKTTPKAHKKKAKKAEKASKAKEREYQERMDPKK